MRAGVQVQIAQQGFNRNRAYRKLSSGSGVAKIVGAASRPPRPITNVVMMGMGEPLLNLTNVVPAMEIMLDDFGFGLSKRRVTLQRPAWCLRWLNW